MPSMPEALGLIPEPKGRKKESKLKNIFYIYLFFKVLGFKSELFSHIQGSTTELHEVLEFIYSLTISKSFANPWTALWREVLGTIETRKDHPGDLW